VAELVYDLLASRQEGIRLVEAVLHRSEMGKRSEDLRLENKVVGSVCQKLPAALRCLRGGSRAKEQRDDEPLHDLALLEMIARPPCMRERTLGCLRALPGMPSEVVRLRNQAPRASETELVVKRLEETNRPFASVEELLGG
jgi:hypothetical protein